MALQTEKSRNLAALAIAAGAAIVSVLFNFTTPARYIENLTYDLRMALAAPPPGDQLVIVKMDDRAVEEMRSQSSCGCISPVDKNWLADVIVALDGHGAKVVLVDYLFDTWRSKEEFLIVAPKLSALRTPVIVAADPNRVPGRDFDVVPNILYADARTLVNDDYDDVVRSYDALPGARKSLAAAVLETLGLKVQPGIFRLRYRAPHPGATAENVGAIAPSFSAGDVAFLPSEFFADKIVMIGRVSRSAGVDAETLGEDLKTTPLRYLPGHYDGTPGVEVHAHAVLQMLQKDRVIEPALPWVGLLALIAALGGAGLGRSAFTWLRALRWLTGLLAAGAVGGWAAFSSAGVMLPMVAPFSAFALAFFVVSRVAATQLLDERKLYATALERYLAPQVIRRIEDGSEPVQIGAKMCDITAMVSDLENSSTFLAETPVELFSPIINGYFDGLFEVLWKHEAMLDKLTGDGVIVLFGAPVLHADHADRAIACARDIRTFSDHYRADVMEKYGISFGRTRLGLHSGEALVGNFGGAKRFNYTAYGQTVVIAARLEASNKEYDTVVLLSEATLERAKNPGVLEYIGSLKLKGVPDPIRAYTPR